MGTGVIDGMAGAGRDGTMFGSCSGAAFGAGETDMTVGAGSAAGNAGPDGAAAGVVTTGTLVVVGDKGTAGTVVTGTGSAAAGGGEAGVSGAETGAGDAVTARSGRARVGRSKAAGAGRSTLAGAVGVRTVSDAG
jgi:hypothetical protein